MIARRRVLVTVAIGAIVLPRMALAQPRPVRISRIAYIDTSSAELASVRLDRLRAGLHDLGYAEGKNLVIEARWAETMYERLPAMVTELLQQKADVIVAAGPAAIRAVQRATTAVPVVIAASGDPLSFGFVQSLSRPGGNITGVSSVGTDLSGKYLELLRVAIPQLSTAAVLMNPGHPGHPDYLKSVQTAARSSGVKVVPIQAGTPSQIEAAFDVIKRERAGALIVPGDGLFFAQARRIAGLAVHQRLPTLFSTREPVHSGGLMSYGPNLGDQFYRAATYVDRILKGANPAGLPVEQPTTFELVINLKTARAIGLTVSPELALRADAMLE
jgi:putative ABC transport system substrate-binding protein